MADESTDESNIAQLTLGGQDSMRGIYIGQTDVSEWESTTMVS